MAQQVALPLSNNILINSKRKCRCLCIRRPLWFINPVTTMIAPSSNKEIPLKTSHLSANVKDSVASMTYTQTYVNNEKVPLECIYKFPIDAYFTVTGMKITVGEKEIDAVIMEKEEAKEKYDDAVAAGHTAAKINYDESIPEILELAIGSIQPGKTVKVDVSIVSKCDVLKHRFYSFVFPVNFIPRYYPTEVKEKQPIVQGSLIPGEFS